MRRKRKGGSERGRGGRGGREREQERGTRRERTKRKSQAKNMAEVAGLYRKETLGEGKRGPRAGEI